METSSVDIDKLLSKNFFLWIQCPKISLRLFKDGADLRMESFSCKQSPHKRTTNIQTDRQTTILRTQRESEEKESSVADK